MALKSKKMIGNTKTKYTILSLKVVFVCTEIATILLRYCPIDNFALFTYTTIYKSLLTVPTWPAHVTGSGRVSLVSRGARIAATTLVPRRAPLAGDLVVTVQVAVLGEPGIKKMRIIQVSPMLLTCMWCRNAKHLEIGTTPFPKKKKKYAYTTNLAM